MPARRPRRKNSPTRAILRVTLLPGRATPRCAAIFIGVRGKAGAPRRRRLSLGRAPIHGPLQPSCGAIRKARAFTGGAPGSPHQQGILAGHAPYPLLDAGGGSRWPGMPKGRGLAAQVGWHARNTRPSGRRLHSPVPRPQAQREEQSRRRTGRLSLANRLRGSRARRHRRAR